MKNFAFLALAAGSCVVLSGCDTLSSLRRPAPPAPLDRAMVQAPASSCAGVTTEVYFDTGASSLTPEARRALTLTIEQLRPCAISSVTIIGLADATGAPSANQALSAQRADSVRQALAAGGISPTVIGLRAEGAAGAVTQAGEVNPLRRQAQIEFKLVPR